MQIIAVDLRFPRITGVDEAFRSSFIIHVFEELKESLNVIAYQRSADFVSRHGRDINCPDLPIVLLLRPGGIQELLRPPYSIQRAHSVLSEVQVLVSKIGADDCSTSDQNLGMSSRKRADFLTLLINPG